MSCFERFRGVLAITAVFTSSVFSGPLYAVTVPDANYTIEVLNPTSLGYYDLGPFTENPVLGIGSLDNIYCSSPSTPPCARSTVSMNAPTITTAAMNDGVVGAYAGGVIQYYYEVVGPAGSVSVPMLISGNVTADIISGTAREAAVSFITYSAINGNSLVYNSPYPNPAPAFSFSACQSNITNYCSGSGYTDRSSGSLNDTPFSVYSNQQQTIYMGASSSIDTYNAGSVTASVDPMVSIDPTWLAENPGYSLVFSANISTVPLPGAFWLLCSGLFGLAAGARRRG